jgi:hypothetical protein
VPAKVVQPEGIIKNPADFWGGMGDAYIKPSISLIITMPLDPDQVSSVPLVFKAPSVSVSGGLGREQITGRVLAGSGDNLFPLPRAQVLVVERGVAAEADDEGQFTLEDLPRGRYILRATAGRSKVERQIEVPGKSYDVIFPAQEESKAASSAEGEPPDSRQRGKSRRR